MPKKPISRKPKTISRKPKTKNKNGVNVNINIDNSKKSTARRTPIKPSNMQPFVNFPSYQPTRIQQLEPKLQFQSPDFTKTMDEYQKQFKTYLETSDKTVKDMIEKYDDTLKKNTAPQKKEESKPGASNVYATDEGETILEEPIAKENINIPPRKEGFQSWSKPNEIKENILTATIPQPLQSNQLQEVLTEPVEGEALNLADFLKNSSKVQFNRVVKSMTSEQIEKVLKKATMEQIEKVLEKAEPKQKLKINNVLTSQETKKIEKVVKPKVLKTKLGKTTKSTELKEIDKIKKELDDKLKQVETDKVISFVEANISPPKKSSNETAKTTEPVKTIESEFKKPRGRPPGTGKVKTMIEVIEKKSPNKSK
jgi:hypothetical protein